MSYIYCEFLCTDCWYDDLGEEQADGIRCFDVFPVLVHEEFGENMQALVIFVFRIAKLSCQVLAAHLLNTRLEIT